MSSFEGEPILSDLESQEKPINDLEAIRALAEGDKDLLELFEDVEKSVDRYLGQALAHDHVARIQVHRLEPVAYKERMQAVDEARRRTHNALHDSLRILARTMEAQGRDTAWWQAFNDDRQKIGQWALKIAFDRMRQREEERNKSHDQSSSTAA